MKRSTRASSKTGEKATEDPQPQKEVEPPRKSARVVAARKANPRVTWNPEPAFWQGIHVQIPLNYGKFKLNRCFILPTRRLFIVKAMVNCTARIRLIEFWRPIPPDVTYSMFN